MENKIKQELNNIKIPKELHERSKKGVLMAKSEMKGSGKRPQNYLSYLAAAICLALLIPLGLSYYSNHSNHHSAESPVQSATKSKQSTTEQYHEKTIQTFLKLEFTGPNEEFIKAFGLNSNQGPDFTLIDAYNKKYYRPIVAEDHYQEFINERYETVWLESAYLAGYQLKPTDIQIKKEKDNYRWTVQLEYTKDGKTKTSTVNGLVSLNDDGKIITVRFINNELYNYFMSVSRKSK